ncbi:related to G/T mismatch-specific thymine DNA glycosylase [Rhynchosporium graminicola]|uniref:Related to G/T mismatch-specific thymine DNA glycosylase n=1 Tax=Rhynchosporium graminicola TaxID=2792576 RepID=A0A1E1KAV7_9HELO|nr:related to G/T mismatch-specific thymine DNA glycosylase [Rhynchosporium commune]
MDHLVKIESEINGNGESLNSVSAPLPPSFKGRLNLADYSFSPKTKSDNKSEHSKQSPRLSSPAISTPKRKSTHLTPSPSPTKRSKSRTPSGYAPPSTYAYLPELRDILQENLICVFIGLNPGIETARSGHAYAHPSNLFWKLLHSSGCTPRRCSPEEDGDLPRLFALGNTNIVARPTRNGSELSKSEMDASVAALEEKIRLYKPDAVCIVGKSIWESIWRVKRGRKIKKEEFRYGWQDAEDNMGRGEGGDTEEWEGALVFVACSTSGLAASLRPPEKEAIWKELGVWVEQMRQVRADALVRKLEE